MKSDGVGNQDTLRLGDDYEFEPRFRTLRRNGCVLKLQRIPLELLGALVEQRGEIVSRDQLVERIWGKGVFLDADNSLNIAIRKLRRAFADNPEQPQFIQTITGQGYRLIAPVVETSSDQQPTDLIDAPLAPGRPIPERGLRWLEPVSVLLVLMIGVSWLYWTHVHSLRQQGQGKLMLAVLPFDNLTGDVGQDFFSDGVTEEMITQVSNLDPQQLGVIARTSVMYYKNRHQPLQQVGRDLGVQYVLEGSVRRNHEQARISVALERVADGATLWTNSFDRPIGDVLSMQSEVAQQIGSRLQIQFLGHARQKAAAPAVVEAYLRGRFELNRLDTQEAAPVYFERSIALDPSYTPAYAGLADFYCFHAVRNDEGSERAWQLADQYASKAISLDSDSVEAHIAIARIKLMHDWDWQAARQHAVRALQLNPNSPEAHTVYAMYLRVAGKIQEDLSQREQALALDPYRDDLKDQLTFEHYFARDYQALVTSARRVLANDPNNVDAHAGLCISLRYLRAFDESAAECGKALRLDGHADWAEISAQKYRQHGYEAARLFVARKYLSELEKRPRPDLWNLANAYASAGMKNETIHTLVQGLQTHEPGLLQIRVDPDFDLIRNDPGYAGLLRRMRFPNE